MRSKKKIEKEYNNLILKFNSLSEELSEYDVKDFNYEMLAQQEEIINLKILVLGYVLGYSKYL